MSYTPGGRNTKISSNIYTNGIGAITAVSLASVLAYVASLFLAYTPTAVSNTALSAIASTAYPQVTRLGFAASGDSPPLVYTPSGSACSLNAGAGDGGSQVPSADGKCWIAQFSAPLDPRYWGAKCDGATDDTTAITRWAASITANAHAVIPAVCVFKSALTFPSVNNVTIDGGGMLAYQGSNLTNNIVTFGTPNAVGGCSIDEWNISNIRFESWVYMTAGFGVVFNEICDSDIHNVTFGGQFGGNTGFWNAAHFNGGNTLHLRGGVFGGQNDGIVINGDGIGNSFTDPYFHQIKVVGFADVGLRIAGFVGGLSIDHADILQNGENVRVDQSQVATANLQLFVGPGTANDVTTVTTIAHFTGSISGTTLTVSSVASGVIQVGNAVAGSGITPNPLILSQLSGTTGGAGTYSLSISEGTISSEAMTTQGSGIGWHVVDVGGGESIETFSGAWFASATNQCFLVDSGVTTLGAYFTGSNILNCNDYGNAPAMIDNQSTNSGVNIYLAGVHFAQCCNYSKYVINNVVGANPIINEAADFATASTTWYQGPAIGSWSDRSNIYNQSAGWSLLQGGAAYGAVIGAGTTSSQCGLSVRNGVVYPVKMDNSSLVCAMNLGSGTYPISDIENITQNISDTSTSNSATLTVAAVNDTNGANIRIAGNGATTPSKYLRVASGVFNILNSAYSATILSLTDAGAMTIPGSLTSGGLTLAHSVMSSTAPTFTSGACTGAIGTVNGTAAFTFTTGSGACGSTATIGMPAATTGWICDAVDEAGGASFRIQETSDTTTSVVFTGYSIGTSPAAANFTVSHTVKVKCAAY
jgi:hypothetical protein